AARIESAAPGMRLVIAGELARAIAWSASASASVSVSASAVAPVLAVDPPHDRPRASSIARIAMRRSIDDADALAPFYLRPPSITLSKAIVARVPSDRPGG